MSYLSLRDSYHEKCPVAVGRKALAELAKFREGK